MRVLSAIDFPVSSNAILCLLNRICIQKVMLLLFTKPVSVLISENLNVIHCCACKPHPVFLI